MKKKEYEEYLGRTWEAGGPMFKGLTQAEVMAWGDAHQDALFENTWPTPPEKSRPQEGS